MYGGVCPVSPLKLPKDATEVIIECSRWGIPDNILTMAMAGGSSPVTLAGHAGHAQRRGARRHHARAAHGAGRQVMYGSSTTAMDLQLAAASVGSPEIAMISAAVAQLARRYMLPSFVAGL